MVYIRSKNVKGIHYAYLVDSKWDKIRGSAVQHTVKYLGRADSVDIGDIPVEYRNDTKILSFLSSHSSDNISKKESFLEKLRGQLFDALCEADSEKACEIAAKHSRLFSLTEFYEDLLTPVLYKVGELWEQNKLSVATEHVCSNVVSNVVHAINEAYRPKVRRATVLVCSPEGELHHLATDILESVLLQRGYRVYNASPSAPANDIVALISSHGPDAILVSVTLPDNLGPVKRLVSRIRKSYQLPIIIGGAATKFLTNVERSELVAKGEIHVATEPSLERALRLIKVILSK